MSAAVIRLPTATTSYYTVVKVGPNWAVQIVTPAPIKALRITIARCSNRDHAVAYGKECAAQMLRPFKAKAS